MNFHHLITMAATTNGDQSVAESELRVPTKTVQLPDWIEKKQPLWGERLAVPEWDERGTYREKNGWKGNDLIHDPNAAVRIIDYFVRYGDGGESLEKGGVGTTLTGVVHFTPRAESHKGYCHGGSMCSTMDDVIGWCGFLVTGECRPWTGFTVQINTSLRRPIAVDSFLVVSATIAKIERRKVSITAKLVDPSGDEAVVHAEGEGLVVINKGVLPEERSSK